MHSATVCLLQELVFCILEGIDLANGHDWDICVTVTQHQKKKKKSHHHPAFC